MFVSIEKALVPLLKEYFAKDGEAAFDFCNRYSNYTLFGENVNEGLKKYSDRIGRKTRDERITLYWARHSWATIAYACGVNKGVINDGLCHVDREMKVTDIYIKKNWKVISRNSSFTSPATAAVLLVSETAKSPRFSPRPLV